MKSTEVQVGRTLHLGTPDNPHPGFPHPPSAIKNNSMNINWEYWSPSRKVSLSSNSRLPIPSFNSLEF